MSEDDDFQSNRAFLPFSSKCYYGGPFLRYAMPGGEIRTLWCFVDGDHAPFRIFVDAGAIIDDLKKMIALIGCTTSWLYSKLDCKRSHEGLRITTPFIVYSLYEMNHFGMLKINFSWQAAYFGQDPCVFVALFKNPI
jgi:hypothetical protein